MEMTKNNIFTVLNSIEERMSKSKHLQFVSSVKPLPYWIAAILWDISMYMVTATLVRYRYDHHLRIQKISHEYIYMYCKLFYAFQVLILFILFDNEAFVSETNFGPTVLLLFLYGLVFKDYARINEM